MRSLNLLLCAAFIGSHACAQSQTLLDRINNVEKNIPRSATLVGTWMLDLRRPGQTSVSTPSFVSYHSDGTVSGPTADGNSSASYGLWISIVGDKYLQTMYLFNYDEKRALTTMSKIRITIRLSEDGKTVRGTTEAVVLDREGREMATIPGGSFTGVRLGLERPADFEAFLAAN